MKVILTGSAGFIGSAVSPLLEHHELTKIDLVTGDDLATCDLPPCDAIIHLAANANVTACEASPGDNWQSNIMLTRRVVEHAQKNNAAVIFASSAAVYGEGNGLPIGNYGLAKLFSEQLVKAAPRFAILRFFNVFGLNQKTGIMGAINRAKETGEFIVNGDGNQTRDFIPVEVVANSIVRAMNISFTWNIPPVDICTGKAQTVNDFIHTHAPGLSLKNQPGDPAEILHSVGDPARAREIHLLV